MFYLTFTADNWIEKRYNPAGTWGAAGYTFIGIASRITGPYEAITYIEGGACDTTLFADTDGRTYAFMPFGDMFVQEIDLSGLTASDPKRARLPPSLPPVPPDAAQPELRPPKKLRPPGPSIPSISSIRWLGERRRILTARNDDLGLDFHPDYLEGPWVIRRGARYVLFYAAPYRAPNPPDRQGYWTGVAYAGHPLGPWKKDPRGQVFHGGHLTTFPGPSGRDFFAYRSEAHPQTRGFLCIDPFDVDANGSIRCAGPSITEQTLPVPARR